jgi:O-antigen ligase
MHPSPVSTAVPLRLGHALPFVLLVLAWLVPNHYYPWSSFWSEGLAACAFALLLISSVIRMISPVRLPLVSVAAAALSLVPLFQWQAGQIHFGGDAWMASLYLLGFGLAALLPALQRQTLDELLGALAWATLAGALISVGLALCQWLGLDGLGLFLMSMPADGRPYANLAQPNQLATLLMLGLVAACALYQRRHLNAVSFTLVVSVLCFGTAMTQSRTAWLELGGLSLWALVMRERAALRITRPAVVAIVAFFALLVLVWPALCEALYLTSGRSLRDASQFGSDLRWQLWLSMIDAIGREPWWGYGWNQVSVAQFHVAADRLPVGVLIEHSHNFALDLLVWNGLPLGLLVLAGLAWWFWSHVRACRDATVAWLLAGIGVVMVHGLLEFPLEYAYFLLPIGLMMGAVEVLSPAGRLMSLSKLAVLGPSVLALTLLAWTLTDYVKVEEHYRQLRFELAGYGPAVDQAQLSDIVLLSQLREFQRFARTEARREMTAGELDGMRKMAERYGYPPVLFRYALAAALNGRPAAATRTLTVLCHIHPPERCLEGLDAWESMATGSYPELGDIQDTHLESIRK